MYHSGAERPTSSWWGAGRGVDGEPWEKLEARAAGMSECGGVRQSGQ
jgi:hypothetical protein